MHDITDFPLALISRNLNKTRRSMLPWKLSKQHFESFAIRGRFSKKCKNFWKFFNVLWLQAAITLQWLQTAGNSLPGLYAPCTRNILPNSVQRRTPVQLTRRHVITLTVLVGVAWWHQQAMLCLFNEVIDDRQVSSGGNVHILNLGYKLPVFTIVGVAWFTLRLGLGWWLFCQTDDPQGLVSCDCPRQCGP